MHKATEATYLREQAARCRRLAEQLTDIAAAATLRDMATEYETAAGEIDSLLMDGIPHPKMPLGDGKMSGL